MSLRLKANFKFIATHFGFGCLCYSLTSHGKRDEGEAPTPTAQACCQKKNVVKKKLPKPNTATDLERSEFPPAHSCPLLPADGDPHRCHPPPPVLAPRGHLRPFCRRCTRPSLPLRRRRRRSLRLGRRLRLGGAPMRALRGGGRAPARCAVCTLRLLRVPQARGRGRRWWKRRHRLP